MRTRTLGLALLFVLSLVLAACNSGGSTGLKIGLVTDVGQLNDHNFNQYSWEGAQDGATKISAPAPVAAQSTVSADIAKNIQGFVDQKFDVIVTVGFAAGGDTIKAAKANPKIKFIGVDQAPCVDKDGNNDTTFACAGDAAALLPNLQGIQWFEQQPGYLAGIVAASLSKSGHIAAIGGTASVPAVPNYMVGYLNGAKSVKSDIKVELQYVSPAADAKAFNDPSGGNAFAKQLLSTNKDVDVIFQVAGATGNGVLQAACDAKIYGIGVDVDQYVSTPATKGCTIVSAEKKLTKNVSDAIVRIKNGTDKGGTVRLGIDTDDVGLSSFHEFQNLITADIQKKIDDATAAMKAGTLKPCVQNDFGACKITKDGQPAP
ncbi:MAG: BMP family ABC transporter substrate-binding protein [Candidatus Limnocylindrales bacterium]